jgi:hypothetical protein
VHEGDLKGLNALLQEHKPRRAVLVSLEAERRKITPAIEVLPWKKFIEELWSGRLGV